MTLNRRTLLTGAIAAVSGTRALAQEIPATTELPAGPLVPPPQIVQMPVKYRPGVILVYPNEFALYWTVPDGFAIRYAVRVGRGNLYEPGEYTIGAKKEWPSWVPTPGMIDREPERWGQFADGMPGGPDNPLGARALYLFQPGRGDTFLRIHGTNAPESIGHAVSNGCVGLINDHMVHLYDQVPLGTQVFLYPKDF
ncbi:L,D-transpeptidase [Pseudoruegeria sp. HB172150]|uniref:L,D-transpeptidase n=1 Tax=Pseudoruegeria sp. HB172150 TaxID=2721164 RepID=UPI001554917A|nr:L,D-transpeptidase [Pseudoruegeria sp. HB172150]